MPDVQRVKFGIWEGLACAHLDLTGEDFSDPLCIVRAFGAIRMSGVQCVTIDGARWGSDDFDHALLSFMADARSESHTVWALRQCTETSWGAAPVWCVLDCSVLLAAPTTRDDLVMAVNKLPWQPRSSEVVVRDPDPSNLHPALLDEVATRLDPEHAWIYVPHDMMDHATQAAARCATPWGVRELRGE